MKIAYTMAQSRGGTDLLLGEVATALAALGLRTCGVVQINTDRADSHRCDMDVRVLPDGPTLRISQTLGALARGCRLDPGALEQAVELTAQALDAGAGVLIVNKFGKHEAEGRGFRDLIGVALARDIPVLVGVNELNKQAFFDFAQGCAQGIAPVADQLVSWVLDSEGLVADVAV